jgi:hypothetical protein
MRQEIQEYPGEIEPRTKNVETQNQQEDSHHSCLCQLSQQLLSPSKHRNTGLPVNDSHPKHLYQLFRGTFTFLVHLSLSKCSTICICGDHFCRKPSWGSSRNSKHKFLRSRVTIYKDQHLLANWARATTMLAVQKRASSYQLWNLDHVCASFGFPSNA